MERNARISDECLQMERELHKVTDNEFTEWRGEIFGDSDLGTGHRFSLPENLKPEAKEIHNQLTDLA